MAAVIVLGFDGSDCAKAALAETARLAKALGRDVIATFGYATNPIGGENQDQERLIEEMARDVTAEAANYLQEAGVPVEVAIVHDRPAASLLDVATQRHASLIVVGTRQESDGGRDPGIGAAEAPACLAGSGLGGAHSAPGQLTSGI